MMSGLPAAALAIYHTARSEHKQRVKALVMSGVLTSFTNGITEPLEFCFIFVSPVPYLLHAFLTGLSFMLMSILHLMIGNVQGGVIDLVVDADAGRNLCDDLLLRFPAGDHPDEC